MGAALADEGSINAQSLEIAQNKFPEEIVSNLAQHSRGPAQPHQIGGRVGCAPADAEEISVDGRQFAGGGQRIERARENVGNQ